MANVVKLLIEELKRSLKSGDRPRLPAGGELLWRFFLDLHRTRTYHSAGPNPISHVEIEAYARLYRWPLQPHHVEAIFALDRAYLEMAYTEEAKRPSGNLTAGAFDAFFG